MAENENIVVENSSPVPQPTKGKRAGAAVKEWFRKRMVSLKRKPQNIALVVLAITSVYFLLILFKVSQAIDRSASDPHTTATGICMFIVTLLSVLVFVSFLNSFPKRKKPSIFFIVLVFVMIAGMIACDIVYYIQMNNCMAGVANKDTSEMYSYISKAQPYIMGHIVLLAITAVVIALIPVYGRLIKKIDTSIKIESATENMREQIDIQD